MKKVIVALIVLAAGWLGYSQLRAGNGPDLTLNGNEVLLATDDLDVRFTRQEPFEGTYMLFGGLHLDHRNAVSNVSLAALSTKKARSIHRRHPDFYRCSSPGASEAKAAIKDLDLVPGDGRTLATLATALDDFEANIRSGGDRVCVTLQGAKLKLQAAEVREVQEDITDTLKNQKYYLVTSAERVDCQVELSGA